MAEFARPDNLMRQLKSSGLFALGVDSAALFWGIVNATWTKGSTTGLRYNRDNRKYQVQYPISLMPIWSIRE